MRPVASDSIEPLVGQLTVDTVYRRHGVCVLVLYGSVDKWTAPILAKRAILGVTEHPSGQWVTRCAREFLNRIGERAGSLLLIRDRDAKFPESFDAVFASEGIEIALSAPQCPRMNAIAERFVRTTRETVTDRLLVLSERHLRTVMAGWEWHYNTGRAHRALDLRAPHGEANIIPFPTHRIQRTPVLSGLANESDPTA